MIEVTEYAEPRAMNLQIDHYQRVDIRPAIDRIIVYRAGLRIDLHVVEWPDESVYEGIRRLRRIEKRKPIRMRCTVAALTCAPLAALN